MPKAILGTKLGMTQIFSPEGKIIPVTVVQAGPCRISQVKTEETDGYNAIQLGYGAIKPVQVNKPLKGHCEKAGIDPVKYFREVPVKAKDIAEFHVGDTVTVDVLDGVKTVDVSGVSKGKGFAGGIKRWNERRGPMSHGSKNHRRPASAGAKGPARVFKGKESPGRLGGDNVTVQNLEVVKIDSERNLLLIRGAVPGAKQSLLFIKESRKMG